MCTLHFDFPSWRERGKEKKNFWVNKQIKVTSMQPFQHSRNTSKWMGIRLLDHLMNIHQSEIFIINHYEYSSSISWIFSIHHYKYSSCNGNDQTGGHPLSWILNFPPSSRLTLWHPQTKYTIHFHVVFPATSLTGLNSSLARHLLSWSHLSAVHSMYM